MRVEKKSSLNKRSLRSFSLIHPDQMYHHYPSSDSATGTDENDLRANDSPDCSPGHAPDCDSLPDKYSVRFACRSECRVIKNWQQEQTLSMFNLLKNNYLPRISRWRIFRMFDGVLRPLREISDRGRQWGVINANTIYLIRLRNFIEIIRVCLGAKEEKHFWVWIAFDTFSKIVWRFCD